MKAKYIDFNLIGELVDSHGNVHYEDLKGIPAADVQPVQHGEWLEREQVADIQIDEWQSCRCSVCKKYHTTPFLYYFNNYNYCPNCGAKMDGEP